MSDDRQAFLDAIKQQPKNYDHRYVYADWLDERGEHEEADRQRKYEPSEKWLQEFAKSHDDFDFDYSEEDWASDLHDWESSGYCQSRYVQNGTRMMSPTDAGYAFRVTECRSVNG